VWTSFPFHPGVLLRLTQQSGANTTAIADAINKELPALRAQLPESTQLLVVSDTSTSIRTAIAGVQEELVTAVILTAIILLPFLHRTARPPQMAFLRIAKAPRR